MHEQSQRERELKGREKTRAEGRERERVESEQATKGWQIKVRDEMSEWGRKREWEYEGEIGEQTARVESMTV